MTTPLSQAQIDAIAGDVQTNVMQSIQAIQASVMAMEQRMNQAAAEQQASQQASRVYTILFARSHIW